MTRKRRTPLILDLEDTAIPEAPAPADAPPIDDESDREEAAREALHRAATGGRPSLLGMVFWTAFGGIVTLALGLWVEGFVTDLFARLPVLGWVGAALLAALVAALAAYGVREIAGVARLRRIDAIRQDCEQGHEGEEAAADRAVTALAELYAGRPELAGAVDDLAEARQDTPDRAALLEIAERRVLADLDRRAERAVTRATRLVAGATALIPVSAFDIVVILALNLRMIREVAECYGGHAGWLGSWRLLKSVASHLLATGAVAATDDLIGPVLGHGIVGRLSRRIGEAAVNGVLTARVGAAAIEVCRPMPFRTREAPRARSLAASALSRWRGG